MCCRIFGWLGRWVLPTLGLFYIGRAAQLHFGLSERSGELGIEYVIGVYLILTAAVLMTSIIAWLERKTL